MLFNLDNVLIVYKASIYAMLSVWQFRLQVPRSVGFGWWNNPTPSKKLALMALWRDCKDWQNDANAILQIILKQFTVGGKKESVDTPHPKQPRTLTPLLMCKSICERLRRLQCFPWTQLGLWVTLQPVSLWPVCYFDLVQQCPRFMRAVFD